MPGMDRTGPMGTGPIGRGMGLCGGGQAGRGFGRGRAGFGRGAGRSWEFSQADLPPADEKNYLKQQEALLENRLESIQTRLGQLEGLEKE